MPVLSRTLRFAVVLSGLLTCTVTHAENYPSRPVKIVVPFPPGGPSDFTARLLADRLAASLKQPFIVENRPGASGNIGTDVVAKAEPDGYTLLLVPETPLTVNPGLYPKLAFDPVKDFATISIAASFSLMLAVHPFRSRDVGGGICNLCKKPKRQAAALWQRWRSRRSRSPDDGVFPAASRLRSHTRSLQG
jgi:tripartite-type tricarboxylate transporter receptor subunit TctC